MLWCVCDFGYGCRGTFAVAQEELGEDEAVLLARVQALAA